MASSEEGDGLSLNARVVAFMMMIADLGVLFTFVCPMLNLLTCCMTTLSHLRTSFWEMQDRMMVTAPSIASATKPFQAVSPMQQMFLGKYCL